MIRHKEIWGAALKYADEHPSDYTNEMYDIVDIEKAFKAGAEWADANHANYDSKSMRGKNGVIINGVAYEFAPREVHGDECEECALHEKCREISSDILCNILFDDCTHKVFKRVER